MRARGWTPAQWHALSEAHRLDVLAFEMERAARRERRSAALQKYYSGWESEIGVLAQLLIGLLME